VRSSLRVVSALAILSFFSLSIAAPLYPVQVLLKNGDAVAGVGLVTTIDNLAVNSSGSWVVQVDTDNPDTNVDSCQVKDGVLLLRENDPVNPPAGAAISSFDACSLSGLGRYVGNVFLRNLPTTADSGVVINDKVLIQESNISTAPEFSPNTPYIGFFEARANASEQVYIVASVDDPLIASTVDRALVIASTSNGSLTGERVLVKEGDVLPGQTEAIADFGTGPHLTAFNDREEILYFADLLGDTLVDGVIYLDHVKLAQEGSPSPVAGRNYLTLSSRGLDLNNYGQVVFKAALDGDAANNEMIVTEGRELIREGGAVLDIDPFHFTSFGTTSGPVVIDDVGNVLWFGDWDDPITTQDTGLFLNDVLIVREGDTIATDVTLTAIASGEDTMAMSDDGRYIVFEGTILVNGVSRNALLRITVDAPSPVPDGERVAGVPMTASLDPSGDIALTWDVTGCPASIYNVYYGDLADVASYTYTGQSCGLDPTGTDTFTPPPGDLYFIVVGQESHLEGVHGFDGEGKARPASAGGACGAQWQLRTANCP
jgi:hypothetical protein